MPNTAEATPRAAIAGNASSFTAEENYAAGLAVECFGADAPETLRFVKHIVERSGKTWLTDRVPAGTDSQTAADSARSAVQREVRNSIAQTAGHGRLLDAKDTKGGIRPGAGALEVNAAAAVAAPSLRVVLREAPQLIALLIGLRLRLLHLRAQACVLSLQDPDPFSKQGQVLTQHRRRAALVDQRLHLFEQRLKHFILRRSVATHGSGA